VKGVDMEWIVIIDLVIKVIRECLENRSREMVMTGLKSPGLAEAWALRSALRNTGLRGKELRSKTREGMELLHNMSDDEIDELIMEAEAPE